MDRTVAKELKREFARQLQEKLSQFRPCDTDEGRQFGRVFRWTVSPSCYVFVLLLLSRQDNTFTIEVAWSNTMEYPLDLPLMTPIDMPQYNLRRQGPIDGRFRFRLAGLFDARGDFWWRVPGASQFDDWVLEAAGQRQDRDGIPALVDQVAAAIDALVRYGMPYVVNATRSE
jgi:hypothetical protein